MTRAIHIYIEGGGDHKTTKARLRQGFSAFLTGLRNHARSRRIRWNIVLCGSRNSAFDDFKTALRTNPHTMNVLLVDAEGPVTCRDPWQHLKARPGDRWDNPGAEDKHCHLMVQTMEAWLIADPRKLQEYYGSGFREQSLPKSLDVEQVPKATLLQTLEQATRNTKKGTYHKTRHAAHILELIRPEEVQRKARFCKRLFETLATEIDTM